MYPLIPTAVWWDINGCPVPDGYDSRSICLKIQYGLVKAGYYPVIITAIGNLKHTLQKSPGVLRDLFFSGAVLKHVLGGPDLDDIFTIYEDMVEWIQMNRSTNPSTAALMLISGGEKDLWDYLDNLGRRFTILRAFPTQNPPSLANPLQSSSFDWKSLLGNPLSVCAICEHRKFVWFGVTQYMRRPCQGDVVCNDCRFHDYPFTPPQKYYWVCKICIFYGKSTTGETFESFTEHLKSRDHALCDIGCPKFYYNQEDAYSLVNCTAVEKKGPMIIDKKEDAKVTVWWDINSCPVPHGYDARKVRPIIESALKKAGYSCPPTIIAIGNLALPLKQSPDVLPAISSTGILLQHVCRGFRNISLQISLWKDENPPPATLMLISSGSVGGFCGYGSGYTGLQAVPLQLSSLPGSNYDWVWERLLEDSECQVLPEKCTESRWVCKACKGAAAGITMKDLSMHLDLMRHDHAIKELAMLEPANWTREEDLLWEQNSLDGLLSTMHVEEEDWDRNSI